MLILPFTNLIDFYRYLSDQETEIDLDSPFNMTFGLISNNETQQVIEQLKNIPDINERSYLGNTLINCSTEYDDYEITKKLLEQGADPNVMTENWCCPLANAVIQKNRMMVQLLLQFGAKMHILYFYIDNLIEYDLIYPDDNLLALFLDNCNFSMLKELLIKYPLISDQIELSMQNFKNTFERISVKPKNSDFIWENVINFI